MVEGGGCNAIVGTYGGIGALISIPFAGRLICLSLALVQLLKQRGLPQCSEVPQSLWVCLPMGLCQQSGLTSVWGFCPPF